MRHLTFLDKLLRTSAHGALVLLVVITLLLVASGCARKSASTQTGSKNLSIESTQTQHDPLLVEQTGVASIESTVPTSTLSATQSVHATPTALIAPSSQPEVAPQAGRKYVALTFDDGPSSYTPRVLAVLKEKNVHATFFVIGSQAKRGSKTIIQAHQLGHQIANHTLRHRYFLTKTTALLKKDIVKSRRVIKKYSGVDTNYVRLPYGATNKRINNALKRMGMKKIFWTHDTRDWAHPGVKRIVHNAITKARNGSIILMHDGGGTREQTIKALPLIIERLKAQGYSFVTVEQLYAMGIIK